MTNNCVDDWEDDWENTDIPDLIVNLQDKLKNRERELSLIEERKKMEEDDLALSEELFDEEKRNKRTNDTLALVEPVKFIKKEKPKELKNLQDKKKQELQEKQKEQSQKQKQKKQQDKRLKDIYGEADIDEFDEMYGDIEDKY